MQIRYMNMPLPQRSAGYPRGEAIAAANKQHIQASDRGCKRENEYEYWYIIEVSVGATRWQATARTPH